MKELSPTSKFLRVMHIAVILTTLSFSMQPARAAAFSPTIGGALLASATAVTVCLAAGNPKELCAGLGLIADPPSTGVTNISMSVAYDTSEFTFDPAKSGFLCQFSLNGDCPAANASAGTLPLALAPSSGLNPGSPLPGSSESLTDTGGVVTLNYTPGSPVTGTGDTNFFLFFFDFKAPTVIDTSLSTVTYLSTGAGTDFTQTSFGCHTTANPDLGCASNTPISGVSLNLVVVPEPGSAALLGTGLAAVLLVIRQRRRGIIHKNRE